MHILKNLIIKEAYLLEILAGTKKIETREIRPNNAKKYCLYDKEGNYTGPVQYDALELFGGYNNNRKGLVVKVDKTEVIILTDEVTNEDIVYVVDGKEYVAAVVEYTLGEVVSTQNC